MSSKESAAKLDLAIESLPEFVSPYRLAQIESQMRDRQIPPQKLYGYIRQGYIAAGANSTGKIQIARSEAARYLASQAK